MCHGDGDAATQAQQIKIFTILTRIISYIKTSKKITAEVVIGVIIVITGVIIGGIITVVAVEYSLKLLMCLSEETARKSVTADCTISSYATKFCVFTTQQVLEYSALTHGQGNKMPSKLVEMLT